MVELAAEGGLDTAGVAEICERARIGRSHFELRFADLEDCFVSLHEELSAEFCARVEPAFHAAGTWHDRVWAAGWAAMRYLRDDPARARFLVVAVNGAGSRAQVCRDRVLQQLADLLDGGRGEPGRRGPTSRCTAEIAAGAIYGTILTKVEGGAIERGEEFLPELVYMATMPYLGARAAEQELLVQPLH